MDDFKLIYSVLRFLDAMTKCEEFDRNGFKAGRYNVNEKQ
jgi:hypothetical protein